MPVVKRPTLRMARFNEWVFPLTKADFEIMRANNVTTYRMNLEVFEMVSKTLLKAYLPKLTPFGRDVFPRILDTALKDVDPEQCRVTRDKNIIRIRYYDDYAEQFNAAFLKLSHLLGRFCFRLRRDFTAKKEGITRVQLAVVFDSSISPSHFYGVPQDETAESTVMLNLSRFARVSFRKSPSTLNANRTALQIVFEDKQGENFVEAFRRSFELHSMDQGELLKVASFFVAATSLIPSEETNNGNQ